MWCKNGRQHHHATYILMIAQLCRLAPGDPHEFVNGDFPSSNWSRSAKRSSAFSRRQAAKRAAADVEGHFTAAKFG